MGLALHKIICNLAAGVVYSVAFLGTEALSQPLHAISAPEPSAFSLAQGRSIKPAQPTTATKPQIPKPFPSFNSEQLDKQLQQYLRYVSDFGTPDILIVGSSRSLWGVDPIVLQQTLANRGDPNLRIYNFGINGATAKVIDIVIRQLLPPAQLPRLIIWADGSRAFNSGRIDRTYHKIIGSRGYRLLLAGVRPTLPQPKALEIKQVCTDDSLSLHSLPLLGLSELSTPTPLETKHLPNAVLIAQTQPLINRAPQALGDRQGRAGFEPLSDRFNPTTYFQRYPRIPGAFDGDYRAFNLTGSQTTALQNVLKYTRSHRVPIVFVNLPLTKIYLDPARTASEKKFRQYLQRFAAYGQWTLYDLSLHWQTQHDYFIDPSHLNRYGAAAVAAHLGQHLVMPMANESSAPWF